MEGQSQGKIAGFERRPELTSARQKEAPAERVKFLRLKENGKVADCKTSSCQWRATAGEAGPEKASESKAENSNAGHRPRLGRSSQGRRIVESALGKASSCSA